jgi:hypothetical protein
MFGGLDNIAQAFSGQRGTVLQALAGGPLPLGALRGQARLAKGKLPELAPPEIPKEWLVHLAPAAKRTFARRRREFWIKRSPSTTDIESLLEFWADKGIVSRQWRLGPCPACMQTSWTPHVNITRPIPCPHCGSRLRLPPQVPIGYSLHRLVAHAIREGIVPVMLAGRFLKRMTRRGFFWLPGVKYRRNDKDGDLDILACCDGHLAVGECKTLGDTPPDTGFWEVILGKFAETVEVGKACRATFAVLAVMAEAFPPDLQERADRLAGPSMRCLLLNKSDLEKGCRSVQDAGDPVERDLAVHDLVVDPMPEAAQPRPEEPREVHTPLFTTTY